MANTDYTFQGWLALDKKSVEGNMVWQPFEPKTWDETDVDIMVAHCGICGSDLHVLRSGWGPSLYPCCVGHEIVGIAVKVGSKVENGIKVGDRVGVGAQSSACLRAECFECSHLHAPTMCPFKADTYNSTYPDDSKSYGGYADYARHPSAFVIKIPDEISSEHAAPMLCGGITLYSPLKQNGCGPGKKVGIVGIGGLGDFGILYAKALGAEKIVAISRSNSKKEDALKLGADEFIATEGDDPDWSTTHSRTLDLIISTVSAADMPLDGYLSLLRARGTFIQVGAPDTDLPAIHALTLIAKSLKLGGSTIGSPDEIREMLELTAEKKVIPWTQARPLKDANQAVVDLGNNKARYRYVLVNEGNVQKLKEQDGGK